MLLTALIEKEEKIAFYFTTKFILLIL